METDLGRFLTQSPGQVSGIFWADFWCCKYLQQQLQGFASIIANKFEHLKTGFVVQYGSPICKHWVAGLQTLGRRFASRKICPTSARHLPATATQQSAQISFHRACQYKTASGRFLTSLRGRFRAYFGHIFGVAHICNNSCKDSQVLLQMNLNI